ncbi:MAG: hypothetical protein ABWZ82_04945 [Candidatus Limnocylindrales bacterium]
MAERLTKVYTGRQEQERDEAEAVAHGWRVVSRDSGREGYKVTFERDVPPVSAESSGGGIRGVTWLFLIWNVVLLGLLAWRIVAGDHLGGTVQETIDSLRQSGEVLALGAVWLIGLVVLGLMWFRGRSKA